MENIDIIEIRKIKSSRNVKKKWLAKINPRENFSLLRYNKLFLLQK